jgi:hypothetical protein
VVFPAIATRVAPDYPASLVRLFMEARMAMLKEVFREQDAERMVVGQQCVAERWLAGNVAAAGSRYCGANVR